MVARAGEHEHSVTPRELVFGLTFVFAFTRVTTLLASEPTWAGIGRVGRIAVHLTDPRRVVQLRVAVRKALPAPSNGKISEARLRRASLIPTEAKPGR